MSGSLFGSILYRLNQRRAALTSNWKLALVAVCCGLITALLILTFDSRSAGPGREIVMNLLFRDGASGDWRLVLSRFVAPIASYLSGGAGGIFAPSLAAGGAVGAYLANIFRLGDVNIFILMGMIGFLAGITHAPFTSFVLVLEMSDRHSAILPMMIAAIIASIAAKLVDSK